MLTLNQLTDLFLKDYATHVAAGILDKQTATWHRQGLAHVTGPLGFRPAAELKPYEVTAISYTPHTMQSIRCLYHWAVRQNLVPRNPFQGIRMPKYKERKRTMTPVEFRLIRREIAKPHRWTLWFMRRTCARPGELRLAQWKDVKWEHSAIVLSEFKCKNRRKDKLRERMLFLDSAAMRVLRYLHRTRKSDPTDHLFPGPGGKKVMRREALGLEFRRALKRLQKKKLYLRGTEGLVPYSVRHTAATAAAASGVNLPDLANIMGHTTVQMTMRYVHPSHEQLRNAINLANRPRPRIRIAHELDRPRLAQTG